jgi:hypothetical protein
LVAKPEGENHLEDPRIDGEDNTKMDLKNKVGKCGLDSSGSG